MKKSVYLKLSQQEANKKLQQSLFERYNRIKQKSCVLGYLYFPFAYIAFSSIAIVSFGYRVIMLLQDIRFTPHYMKTVIEHNNMTVLQANEYLDTQLFEYKKRLSYGNISTKEKNNIDTTFCLLYDEYKLPVSDDKHEEIISNISNLQVSVDKTNNGVGNVVSAITDISASVDKVLTYTEQKQVKEEAEILREQTLREEQEKRQTTAYNREKGKKLTSFESALSDKQIKILTNYCNRIPVFDRDIEFQEMKNILLCTHSKPSKVTVNKYIALLFTELCNNKFICKTWKSVAERYKCFVSSENKILNSNDLYMANQTSGLIEQKVYDLIEKCIEEIVE